MRRLRSLFDNYISGLRYVADRLRKYEIIQRITCFINIFIFLNETISWCGSAVVHVCYHGYWGKRRKWKTEVFHLNSLFISPWSGSSPTLPDGVAPLWWGAEQGEGHPHVSGQQGLPLRLESVLEGGRQQQHQLGGKKEPCFDAEGRPLQLEQHPDAWCRPVGEGGLCDLWGQTGLPGSSLTDTEERPVFLVLIWLTGTLTLVLFCFCFQSVCLKSISDFILKVFLACVLLK